VNAEIYAWLKFGWQMLAIVVVGNMILSDILRFIHSRR
jgi:hypothetical protein